MFSIVTPVFNTDVHYLDQCVQSVLDQDDPDWQLILVDNGSTDPQTLAHLEALAPDPRIAIRRSPANLGIAAGTNLGLDWATGSYVALLDHDDMLTHDALALCRAAIASRPDIDYLYSDEDKIDAHGRRFDPFFKPDWSPERLRGQMYTCHLSVFRRELVESVGRLRPAFDGAQDHDLVLRVTERTDNIHHIPSILYHWRAGTGSTAASPLSKPTTVVAAARAVTEHCARIGLSARVEPAAAPNCLRVRRLPRRPAPLVSLLIPTRGTRVSDRRGGTVSLLECLIASIGTRTTYPNFEVLVGYDTDGDLAPLSDITARSAQEVRWVAHEPGPEGFNFSGKMNNLAARARGEVLILLNDDIEVITPDWVEELSNRALEPGIGAVGAKLVYEDGGVQHGGVSCAGLPRHYCYQASAQDHGPFSSLRIAREVAAVTGACMAIATDRYFEVGGLTERLPVNFNDVDICLKLRHLGYRNIWTPFAELIHLESRSRSKKVNSWELELLRKRWPDRILVDETSNPNLRHTDHSAGPWPDWQEVERRWPERLVGQPFEVADYLAGNHDLAEAVRTDPEFDPMEHYERFGRHEGRTILRTVRRNLDRLTRT